jgi:hypothetical protein
LNQRALAIPFIKYTRPPFSGVDHFLGIDGNRIQGRLEKRGREEIRFYFSTGIVGSYAVRDAPLIFTHFNLQ